MAISRDASSTSEYVVVVGGDRAWRQVACAMLETGGFEAASFAGAGELRAAVARRAPALVLCDVSPPTPFRDAVEFVRSARAAVEGRFPIAVIGSQKATQLSILARACHATGWVERSIDPLLVLRSVRAVLALTRNRPSIDPLPTPEISLERRSSPSWGLVKLLLVDDSEIALALMQERLCTAGFDVRIAIALAEVQSILRGWSPNVLLVDVHMPEIRGDALCARLRAEVGQDTLIVLCSSMPAEELEKLAEASGADGFVSKSHGLETFVDAVSAWCRKLSDPIVSIQ